MIGCATETIPGGNEEVTEDDVDLRVLKDGVVGERVRETISEDSELCPPMKKTSPVFGMLFTLEISTYGDSTSVISPDFTSRIYRTARPSCMTEDRIFSPFSPKTAEYDLPNSHPGSEKSFLIGVGRIEAEFPVRVE